MEFFKSVEIYISRHFFADGKKWPTLPSEAAGTMLNPTGVEATNGIYVSQELTRGLLGIFRARGERAVAAARLPPPRPPPFILN